MQPKEQKKHKRYINYELLTGFLLSLAANVLVAVRYWSQFAPLCNVSENVFAKQVHISGFDAYTYYILTHWCEYYEIIRHPLFMLFLWPFYLLNRLLINLSGQNCAVLIMAMLLTAAGTASFMLMNRLAQRVIGLGRFDGWLVSVELFSFAYVMVSVAVPDHFGFSLMLLLLTLYVAGLRINQKRTMGKLETIALFFATAGVSLSNGVKVFLAQLFANGRRFFSWRNLLLVVALPTAAIWGIAQLQFNIYKRPLIEQQETHKRLIAKRQRAEFRQAILDTTSRANDEAFIKKEVERAMKRKAVEVWRQKHHERRKHQGDPIKKEGYWGWTDATTPRWPVLRDNFFGESILLHEDYLLWDVLATVRPITVDYRHAWQYVVQSLVLLMALGGVWLARRKRLMWLALSWLAFDLLLHLGLGFGITEVQIMTAHWAFVLPLATAYLLRLAPRRAQPFLRGMLCLLTAVMLFYNGNLFYLFLFG